MHREFHFKKKKSVLKNQLGVWAKMYAQDVQYIIIYNN